MELKTVATKHVPVRYFEAGQGPDLVFLHGENGIEADSGFVEALAQRFHVYAPLVPGYGDSEECPELRDMLDFTLHSWDFVDTLGLRHPILAGFSMGGMIAGEMAALCPREISRLALIAPAGLWLDQHPIPDIFSLLPYELPKYLYFDERAGAQAMGAGVDLADPKFLQSFLVRNARQLGAAGKMLFPIPERGLATRLYRIQAQTVLIWGESDRLIPPVYARAFEQAIAHTDLVMIPQAGHMVAAEKTAEVVNAIARFI